MVRKPLALLLTLALVSCARAQPTTTNPATRPIQLPGIEVDREHRQVRVECQVLAVDGPLEFYCVTNGGPEHEAVVRTAAKPSEIHAGLLMLGLQPGSPMRYNSVRNTWSAPFGPPIRVSISWTDDQHKTVTVPAEKLLRSTKDKSVAPNQGFIFAGSHQREDGAYLADLTGYVVSICNFENTLIDVPRLVSSDNATLEWEYNTDVGPARGTKVTMVLEPIGGPSTQPSTQAADDGLTDQQRTEVAKIAALRDEWRAAMKPHESELHEAAKAHYAIIAELRKKQEALIDEADRLQALMDELDRAYQEMTAPRP